MGRKVRFIPPNSLVEVTCRTVQGRFLLQPSEEFDKIFVGILARAQNFHSVRIHGFVALSNHYHLLISPQTAWQLARFMQYVNTNVSKEAGRLSKWDGPIFQGRYHAIVVSDESRAQVGRLRYLLAHGVKEGLVARACEWPGPHCARSLSAGEPAAGVWIDRSAMAKARNPEALRVPGNFIRDYTLQLAPLPCWSHLSPETRRDRIREMLEAIEKEAARGAQLSGAHPLGPAVIEAQDPKDSPLSSKRSPAPWIHAASRSARRRFVEAYAIFLESFRSAAREAVSSVSMSLFPEGCFPPPLSPG